MYNNIEEKLETEEEYNIIEEYNIDNPQVKDETIMEEETITEEENETIERPNFINVVVNFPRPATPVDCISATTNTRDKIVASNKQIRLLQNRFYFIPVNVDPSISSDNYSNIKIYSEKAAEIDVRYVKDGFACIIALKHNTKIRQDELLAVLY